MHNKLSLCSLLITFLHLPVTSTSFSPNKLSPGFSPWSVLSGHVWDTLSASTPFSKKQLFLDCWWKCKMIQPLQRQFGMKINRSDRSVFELALFSLCEHYFYLSQVLYYIFLYNVMFSLELIVNFFYLITFYIPIINAF